VICGKHLIFRLFLKINSWCYLNSKWLKCTLYKTTIPLSETLGVDGNGGAAAFVVAALFAVLVIAVVALLYAPALMARTNGKTLGRMAVGIRVIRADGGEMSFGFAMLREVLVKSLLVGALASVTFGLAYLLDVLWPLWDEENRALHDFVVNTRTIVD
jgi:uncharacterized RDD family membrane protein YckC